MTTPTVPFSTKLSYALPAVVLAMMGIPFYVLIPKFYTGVVGVSAGAMGLVILISRIWDAVIDPLIGQLSDRTTHRFGRRRVWLLIGVLPLAVCFYLLCAPPTWLSPSGAVGWVAVSTFMFFLFWTIVSVPYQALGPELAFDYDDRTRLLGMRDGGLVLGTLLAIIVPYLISTSVGLTEAGADQYTLFLILGVLYGILLVALVAQCLWVVREPRWAASMTPSGSFFGDFQSIFRNRPFVILLIAYTIGGFGSQLPSAMFLYYVEYVLGATKEQGYQFLILYFVVGFGFMPLWIWLATKFDKRDVWIAAMIVNVGSFAGVLLLGPGDIGWYTLVVALSGIGYGAVIAIPSSMQGDVIDYDEVSTGKRREGQFVGLWLVSSKIAGALGAGVGQLALASSGYVPNVAQSAAVQQMLTILYGAVPCVCYALAMVVAFQYPLSRARYAEVKGALEARGGRMAE